MTRVVGDDLSPTVRAASVMAPLGDDGSTPGLEDHGVVYAAWAKGRTDAERWAVLDRQRAEANEIEAAHAEAMRDVLPNRGLGSMMDASE